MEEQGNLKSDKVHSRVGFEGVEGLRIIGSDKAHGNKSESCYVMAESGSGRSPPSKVAIILAWALNVCKTEGRLNVTWAHTN